MKKNKKDEAYYYRQYGDPNAQNSSKEEDNKTESHNDGQSQASGSENFSRCDSHGGNCNYNSNSGTYGFNFDRQNYDYPPQDEREIDIMDIKANKIVYILSFLWILFFLPLVVCPNAKNAHFYANQGLVLLLAGIVVTMVTAAVGWIVDFFFVRHIWGIISWSARALLGVLTVLGIVWVAQNEKRPLPVIGRIVIIR